VIKMTLLLFFGMSLACSLSQASSLYDSEVAPGIERMHDRSSVQILALGLSGALVAGTQDDYTRERWKNNQQIESKYSDYGDKFGTYGISFLIAGGQWFWDRENGKNHLRALVAVTVLGTSVKWLSHRERPNKANFLSFPSGHTYGAFATATSLTYAYGWKVGAVMFPVATFVGLSRISSDDHWLSDVVAGAVLGIYMGRLTYYGDDEADHHSQSLWIPLIEQDRMGVQWISEFQ
jgi:hypothetical protein